jgi:hypothetical protein
LPREDLDWFVALLLAMTTGQSCQRVAGAFAYNVRQINEAFRSPHAHAEYFAMRFSWNGLLLAPLLVPIVACAVMTPVLKADEAPFVLTFLLLLVPACVISYGAMVLLFLPALFLLSLLRPVTGWMACLLGLVIGAAVFVPVARLAWATGGPNSGHMQEDFWDFFAGWLTEPFMLFYPVGGLVTAALYWWLGTRRHNLRANNSAPKN